MGRGSSKVGSAGIKYPPSKANDYIQKRFPDLNAHEVSNNYWSMDRVSKDGNTVVVKVADSHIIDTRYGHALILDNKHVVFLYNSEVSRNYYGNEVIIKKDRFKPKEWGNHTDFGEEPKNLKYNEWKNVAKQQQKAGTEVKFEKTAGEKITQSFQRQAENRKKKKR